MSSECELLPGQGIEWASRVRGRSIRQTCLVVGNEDGELSAVPVRPLTRYVRCYDDAGASYELDRDNVRLDHSPDVFTAVRADETAESGQCYVYADMGQARSVSRAFLKLNHVEIIDGGRKIDDRDMNVVKNHPWPHDMQQEKTSGSDGVPHDRRKKVDDLSADDDEELVAVDPFNRGGVRLSPEDIKALDRKAQNQRRREDDAEDFMTHGSGDLRKALAEPGSLSPDGGIGPGKTGPNGPGE